MEPRMVNHGGITVLVEPQENGAVHAYAAWGNRIHGVAVYLDGKIQLNIDKYGEIEDCPFSAHFRQDAPDVSGVSGEDLYDSLFNSISSEYPVNAIEHKWLYDCMLDTMSLNLKQYNEALLGIVSPTPGDKRRAVMGTFSGKMAKKHGFDDIVIEREDGGTVIEHVVVLHIKKE